MIAVPPKYLCGDALGLWISGGPAALARPYVIEPEGFGQGGDCAEGGRVRGGGHREAIEWWRDADGARRGGRRHESQAGWAAVA